MKTRLLALVAVVLAAFLAATAAPALPATAVGTEELIRNGGFEDLTPAASAADLPADVREFYGGTHPCEFAGWRFGGGWEAGKYSMHVSQEAHGGRQSCEIRCEKKGRGGIASTPFKLPAGTAIEVSFWAKARGATGGRVFLNFEGSPGDGWDTMDFVGGTYDWRQFRRRCVLPPRGQRADGQTVVVFIYSKAGGSLWIDDVSVRTVDPKAPIEPGAADAATSQPARRPKVPAEPAESIGYRVAVATALEKVQPDADFPAVPAGAAGAGMGAGNAEIAASAAVGAGAKRQAETEAAGGAAPTPVAAISMARNEYEAVQVVVEAPWREVTIAGVEVSALTGPGGAVMPAESVNWRRVDFVRTTVTPPYAVERMGLWPDPLMPAGRFTVPAASRAAVWLTVHTAKDTPAGVYRGTVTVRPEGRPAAVVPLTVTVWDFVLPDQTHLRTLTWLGTGTVRAWYGLQWSPADERTHAEHVRRYQDILLEHRLGPGGEVAASVPKDAKTGKYDFAAIDASLERLIGKGMNAFIMGTAPNLKREGKKEYTPEFLATFGDMLKAYGDHLRQKGWIDKAYVYTYDEAPKAAWPEVKKVAKAIRAAAPELKILQCLNEPEGVQALAGTVDVFDVYVAHYHKAGVAPLQQRGTEVWLAVCCYPMDHPNLFIEYPLMDARCLPMFCWKYGAAGFEYWSPNAWGRNTQAKGPNQWPATPWNPNTFGEYNGDGYLLYPGPDGVPYPSIRLEALRDGLEDYEYLWLLKELAAKADASSQAALAARGLLKMDELIGDDGTFPDEPARYFAYRQKLAAAIVELQKSIATK